MKKLILVSTLVLSSFLILAQNENSDDGIVVFAFVMVFCFLFLIIATIVLFIIWIKRGLKKRRIEKERNKMIFA